MKDKLGVEIRTQVFIPTEIIEHEVGLKADAIAHLIQQGVNQAVENLGAIIIQESAEAAQRAIRNSIENHFDRFNGEGKKVVEGAVGEGMKRIQSKIRAEL